MMLLLAIQFLPFHNYLFILKELNNFYSLNFYVDFNTDPVIAYFSIYLHHRSKFRTYHDGLKSQNHL